MHGNPKSLVSANRKAIREYGRSLRRWEEVVAEELHPWEQQFPLRRHSVMDKAFSESDVTTEVMTDLHDTTHGELGEHDRWYNVRTDCVGNGVCLKLSVKDWK
jgi:hypothetical protein